MGTLTGTAYAAARWLEESEAAPQLLLGHSLGGAAAVAAAGELSGIEAVFTIAAPSDPSHVRHLLGQGVAKLPETSPSTSCWQDGSSRFVSSFSTISAPSTWS